MEENRKKALAAALSQIEKQFGKGSVMRLGDAAPLRGGIHSTGSLGSTSRSAWEHSLCRVIEIFGPESSARHG